ncbi:DUF3817 domain-containing protein [Flavobacteriaceae bacterium]|nr:DUF3817 domain-containing protein [Flavobacteriaceae bacterium]
MKKGIKVFKIISSLEAISFIVLLFIAMPLKYIWDMPQLVKVVGMAHGVLFILYIAFAIYAWRMLHWSVKKLFIAIICSSASLVTVFNIYPKRSLSIQRIFSKASLGTTS